MKNGNLETEPTDAGEREPTLKSIPKLPRVGSVMRIFIELQDSQLNWSEFFLIMLSLHRNPPQLENTEHPGNELSSSL
jgi:hypothetical protein